MDFDENMTTSTIFPDLDGMELEIMADNSGDISPAFQPGDTAWTLVATAMVWLMVPGVGFLYCGMARSKSALSLLTLCLWSTAVVSVQVSLYIYSVAKDEDA